jgi:superfamily II DNA or RNA helicase
MNPPGEIRDGQILRGRVFNEPVRVVTVRAGSNGDLEAGLVGQRTQQFRQVTLSAADIAALEIIDPTPTFDGDGRRLRLGLQAYALGIAHEFDPYFSLSISKVDPLPHQLEAVYEHFLKLPSVRFLLADDAGAGKTIMAGLLIRELKMRGLIERILVVCPANLSFQWQREMKEKFEQQFMVLKGGDVRDQFGVNQWLSQKQVITSLDFAKRDEIRPGLAQAQWDLVIVDEAHRMSARDESHKSQRYQLGEQLRDSTDNLLLLTATPHKGDPENFTLFLQLLDRDAYADVRSVRQAMDNSRAPFYLRRTKEAMVYFPQRQADGAWASRPVFTKRITHTAGFLIDGDEFGLYLAVTKFVKRQSARAAAHGDDRRARAVGFLMSLYQRRLASSTHALQRSLENRANRLTDGLEQAHDLAKQAPPGLDWDDVEELEDAERERLERILEAVTLTGNAAEIREEIGELRELGARARTVEESGEEAKLSRLRETLDDQGFFADPTKQLLIFTEYRDTLNYLVDRLRTWGLETDCIHGSMKPGSRDEPGTRLHAEQQFRDGATQVLVATEAAGEGINLQCCHILFNYDIPWNPNRLEQRMGRIHRYGQRSDCIIFNFVAANTIEGRVLERLLTKLQEIRDALDDDAVFNVVGEVLPAAHIDRVFREYYAGGLGEADLEERLLRDVDADRFRAICQTALEGLSVRQLNLEMLVERRARAQRRRVVPEHIARFMSESARDASLDFKPVRGLAHTFDVGRTPGALRRYESEPDWSLPQLSTRYRRVSTARETAETRNLEWVTPGHPLFEALRRHSLELGQEALGAGACFHALERTAPARLDFYRAQIVDGLGHVIHERLFVVELSEGAEPRLREPDILGNLTPAAVPATLPAVASMSDRGDWLREHALTPFLGEVRAERLPEIDRIAEHVDVALRAVLLRADEEIGRAADEVEQNVAGAEGRLVQAESRHAEVTVRQQRRRRELEQQQALTLQGVERLASVLVLPHPERESPDLRRLRPDPATEMTAMRVAIEHERAQGRHVDDVHEQDLGYDVTSIDQRSGDLRLIEIKGLAAATGTVLLTPNEYRVAEDRRDCYWLYVVTNCVDEPSLQTIANPAQFPWHEVRKIQYYWLDTSTMLQIAPAQNETEQDGRGLDHG